MTQCWDEFRAELARGAPSIELADNLYLEGEELNVTAPCVIDGRGYVLQNDARHFRASASLDLRNVTLVRAGYAPTPSPTCAPTPVAEEESVDPLELVDIFNAGIGTCDDTNKRPARSVGVNRRRRCGQYESRLKAGDERAKASAPSREAWARQRWLET